MREASLALLLVLPAIVSSCDRAGGRAEAPTVVAGAWFPSGVLHPGNASVDSFSVAWYSKELAALDEPVLATVRDRARKSYRFLWLRSFHAPVSVRIEQTAGGPIAIVGMNESQAFYGPSRPVRRDTMSLAPADERALRTAFEQEGFWQLPTEDPTQSGLDGSNWVIEAVRAGRYHVVDRWTPSDTGRAGGVKRLGRLFLRLGQITPDPQAFY